MAFTNLNAGDLVKYSVNLGVPVLSLRLCKFVKPPNTYLIVIQRPFVTQ